MVRFKRAFAYVTVPLLAAGATTFALAGPALAACSAPAHVYETNNGRYLQKTENDSTFGPYLEIHVDVPSTGTQEIDVRVGGDGLRPDVAPFWRVYSGNNGGYVGYLGGSFTNSSCVSNEKTYPLYGQQGDFYLVKASYPAYASGAIISDQAHFAVYFD